MKKVLAICFALLSSTIMAADLFVQEFGGGGTYPNISDAITAANAGDRIFIVPKAGNAPYIESLTINKSLQLLTASNGAKFYLQGSVSISNTISNGSSIVIDGMINTGGSINGGGSSIVNVSIVNCEFQNGYIYLGGNTYATIANNMITSTAK